MQPYAVDFATQMHQETYITNESIISVYIYIFQLPIIITFIQFWQAHLLHILVSEIPINY